MKNDNNILLLEVNVSHESAGERFSKLLGVMAQLRGQQGCPWDREQTHESLKPCLLEETYELLEALDEGDAKKMCEELGDVLLQVIFHSQIAAEQEKFTAEDVIEYLTDKLIRRHPYVYAGEPLPADTGAVQKQRLQIKANEATASPSQSALGAIPRSMPALARAQRVTERASQLGFDWPNVAPVWNKIEEEIQEIKDAAATGNHVRVGEELGDLLFTVVNLSRFLELQAEDLLSQTSDRFIRRFNHIEDQLRKENKNFDQVSLEQMDAFWEEAKKLEASSNKKHE